MVHDIATDDGTEDNYQADDDEHARVSRVRVEESVSGDEGRGAQLAATAGVTRWLTVHDELLRGVAHALSNRLGTLAALTGILEAGIMPDARLVGGLSDDGVQLERLLQVLRQLPRGDSAIEPMLLGDAVDMARHLVAEHPAFRGRGTDGVREVLVRLEGDVVPVRADPTAVAHATVVALLAAARSHEGPVQVTLETIGDVVRLLAHGSGNAVEEDGALHLAEHAVEDHMAADRAAVAWLLNGSAGLAIHEGDALGFTLPTLAATRRPRT
ncbi:MAG: hypothetical protein IBJ03_19120 [Gemmatimonadaceae bacterium]|nr:hypothetical protein [Gemmatimonadaceae bacterium]